MSGCGSPLSLRMEQALARPRQIALSHRPATSILTRATGFIDSFDFTLNPYSGCAFGCSYCYAAFFPRTRILRDTWGTWVQIKSNAVAKLEHMRRELYTYPHHAVWAGEGKLE